MLLSLQGTHHEAGAGLRAGQLAGARNLAHHQSLKLLQLLEKSSAKVRDRHHEGTLREKTRHWALSGPELQDNCCDFEPGLEQSAEGMFPWEGEADTRALQRRVAELPRARNQPRPQLVQPLCYAELRGRMPQMISDLSGPFCQPLRKRKSIKTILTSWGW